MVCKQSFELLQGCASDMESQSIESFELDLDVLDRVIGCHQSLDQPIVNHELCDINVPLLEV